MASSRWCEGCFQSLPLWLRRAHISEVPSLGHLFEAMPAPSHGDRTGWSLGSIAGPTAKARNNPGKTGDRMPGMRVLLLGRLSFKTGLQGLEHRQLVRRNNVSGRAVDTAVKCEHELPGLGGYDHRDGGEFEHRFSSFKLTPLEV